jgi:hypothetical protein
VLNRLHLLASLGCLAACGPRASDTPEDAYRALAVAANKGDDAAAFARLSTQSQAALQAALGGLGAASGGSLREDAPSFVFGGGRAAAITGTRLLKMEQDRATVAVTTATQTHDVTLVREGSEWRVELVVSPPPAR